MQLPDTENKLCLREKKTIIGLNPDVNPLGLNVPISSIFQKYKIISHVFLLSTSISQIQSVFVNNSL